MYARLFILAVTVGATPVEAADFTFPSGDDFAVEKVAGSELAHDIYTLTLDERGRVFVSGRGYIRRLDDRDGDGHFDAAIEYAAGPGSGCMGMAFRDGYLYTTGGKGLERYEDKDDDGKADGPPKLLLALATGGEHSSHALRFGPDGDLWFLGGNYCRLRHDQVGQFSPVKDHFAGLFCRIAIDGSNVEVFSEGMRNAYDFDFPKILSNRLMTIMVLHSKIHVMLK
ncbi:MAG: hypothetical protein AAF517_24680 [Planctomycetota bacterium]